MARLIYATITSLDGYVEDADGDFGWGAPDEEVFAFINDLVRPVGTYLYGRRMYDTMMFWESFAARDEALMWEFAETWRAADKIVFSGTLEAATSDRTRIEASFDPRAIRQMKASADKDLTVSGAELAARAFEAGLVDDCHLFLTPVIVGGGKRALPSGAEVLLDLVEMHRFGSGVVHLHYKLRS